MPIFPPLGSVKEATYPQRCSVTGMTGTFLDQVIQGRGNVIAHEIEFMPVTVLRAM